MHANRVNNTRAEINTLAISTPAALTDYYIRTILSKKLVIASKPDPLKPSLHLTPEYIEQWKTLITISVGNKMYLIHY